MKSNLPTYRRPLFDYAAIGADLAAQAQQAATRIRAHERAAAIDIGRELLAMKEALPHGQFIPWVDAEFGFTRRTATNLMQVAAEFGDEPKWATVSHLPPAVLYQLAAPSTPAEVRAAVLKVEPGKLADPRAIADAIKKAKAPKAVRMSRDERETQRQATDIKRERERAQWRADKVAEDRAAEEAVGIILASVGDQLSVLQAALAKASIYRVRELLLAAIEQAAA